jgi:primase-polymerase (primpol)-like protein
MERPRYIPKEAAIPEPLAVDFDNIPKRLRDIDQFVVWKYAIVDGEIKKPPCSPKTGKFASVRNPASWGSFHDAQQAYKTGTFAGIGMVLTSDRGIVAIDIDHCIVEGKIQEEAQQIITPLHSYTEISPSGTGIRIMLAGKLPAGARRQGNIEMYEDLRYVTLTGQHLANTPPDVQPRHRELSYVYHRVFALMIKEQGRENTGMGGERPASGYHVTRSDQQVLQKALAAKNGENFRRYYYGDSSLWEDAGAKHASQSEADFTLALMLLYWTNNDMAQTERLFRQSGLMREKWHRPLKGNETYGERLIYDAMKKRKH